MPAERVVDDAESIHVEDDQRHSASVAGRRGHLPAQPIEEKRPVRQAGQRVIVGKVVDLLLLRDECQRERNVACELLEEFQFSLVVERVFLARIQNEDAGDLVFAIQRQADDRFAAALDGARADPIQGTRLRDVVVDHDAVLGHGPCRDAARVQGPVRFFSRFAEVLRSFARPHLRAHDAVRVPQCDPRDAERTVHGCDSTGLVKQFFAVSNAHDRGIDSAQHGLNPVQAQNLLFLFPSLADVPAEPNHAADVSGRVT